MGLLKKVVEEVGLGPEANNWVVAGISIRAALRPVSTKPKPRALEIEDERGNQEEEEATTPKGREARIPDMLPCPAAPRKRRPRPSKCHIARTKTVFLPPDLESLFELRRC